MEAVRLSKSASLVFLLAILTAFAQDVPDLSLGRKDLTVLGLTVGSSTRSQVEGKLGKARSFKFGRGEQADEAVCYRSDSKDDDTVLIVHFGALGGWVDVTEISISTEESLSLHAKTCTPSKSISRDLEFLRGIKLGLSTADVIRVLGHPSRASKNKLSYYVSHPCSPKGLTAGETTANPSSSCVVVDSVTAKFSLEDRLIYASFYHFVDQ